MKYLSTRNNSIEESFATILFQGLSKDGGLFLPTKWPTINLNSLDGKTYEEVAFDIIYPFVKENISSIELKEILNNTFDNFNHAEIAPLINLGDNKFIMELFHGPTLAFKDYAMQFLGNIFSYMHQNSNKKATILGATSGDTGAAAIEAFKDKENINLFILHPFQMVSEAQRRQMSTVISPNIHNIALQGTFDDCQKIIKNIFLDREIQSKTSLSAVNSINWARIIAQTVYYFWAYSKFNKNKISFIVPSGNFGNIFSARIAKYMGLPIQNLNLVTNANDILHRIISSGQMQISTVKKTYSPSMDIQVSSNFERQLFESLNRDSEKLLEIMQSFTRTGQCHLSKDIINDLNSIYKSYSVSNEQNLDAIANFKKNYNYLADPHTATGLHVLDSQESDHPIISLACAHPAKFSKAIKKATGVLPLYPQKLKKVFDKEEKFIILSNNFNEIKDYICRHL